MNKCIYCNSEKNLNTQLTILLGDGNRVTVVVCDEHADDASVKSARMKYIERQDKINEFLEQAKILGIEVTETVSSGLAICKQEPTTQEPTTQEPTTQEPTTQEPSEPSNQFIDQKEKDDGWTSTAKIDNQKGMQSIGGSTEMGNVQAHSSYVVSGQNDILSEQARRGKVKMSVAEGRAGTPIVIPETRIDGTGTTRIRIVNKESDDTLQRRFKNMAQDSQSDNQPDFRRGYNDSTRNCPICRGECVVNGKNCPKCNGTGVISIY